MRQVKIRISGRVQGVGFRYFTHQQARKFGLVGYVKNLDDGDVEIVAQGDSSQVEQLLKWLEKGGPASARISRFVISELSPQEELTSFNVRY